MTKRYVETTVQLYEDVFNPLTQKDVRIYDDWTYRYDRKTGAIKLLGRHQYAITGWDDSKTYTWWNIFKFWEEEPSSGLAYTTAYSRFTSDTDERLLK